MSLNFITSHLIASGCDDKLVVHSFTKYQLADDNLSFGIDLIKQLSIIVMEHPARRVEVLFVSEDLIDHIFVFQVSL